MAVVRLPLACMEGRPGTISGWRPTWQFVREINLATVHFIFKFSPQVVFLFGSPFHCRLGNEICSPFKFCRSCIISASRNPRSLGTNHVNPNDWFLKTAISHKRNHTELVFFSLKCQAVRPDNNNCSWHLRDALQKSHPPESRHACEALRSSPGRLQVFNVLQQRYQLDSHRITALDQPANTEWFEQLTSVHRTKL